MIMKELLIRHINCNLLISNVNPIALKRAEKFLPCRPLAPLNACSLKWLPHGMNHAIQSERSIFHRDEAYLTGVSTARQKTLLSASLAPLR